MKVHEQEFLLSKIIAGYSRHFLPKNIIAIVKPMSIDQKYMAQEVFCETYELAKDRGIFTSEDILHIMIDSDMWTPLDVRREEQIPKDIENIKVQMFKDAFKLQERETRRTVLRKMEEQLLSVMLKKHSYDFVTCEGISTYARWNWIIENCTYFSDGSPFDWKSFGISSMLQVHKESIPDDKKIRGLSRGDVWRNIWSAGKKEKSIFGKPAIELTEEQKSLCMWSSLYDSVYDSQETPADEIIKDDDLLDGWLIHQRRKADREKKKQKADGILGKNSEADDVFVVAHSREDALEVESMNDDVGTMIKKERQAYKDKADGYIKDTDLPDVKRGIMAQAREQFKNRR